jgi:hypothetical protein
VCRLSPIDCFSITTMKIDKIYWQKKNKMI